MIITIEAVLAHYAPENEHGASIPHVMLQIHESPKTGRWFSISIDEAERLANQLNTLVTRTRQ